MKHQMMIYLTERITNGGSGLKAYTNPIINIYIPSRSITALVHDNRRDLNTDDDHVVGFTGLRGGGKIQSQLSSSSLELTVIQEAPPVVADDQDY